MDRYTEVGMQRVDGRLGLHFNCDREQHTQLTIREQRPPLQVIRAFPLSTGGALVHIHNNSGGVLGEISSRWISKWDLERGRN